MDKRRHLDALNRLASIQQLRVIDARGHLADCMTTADQASNRTAASENERTEAEGALEQMLALAHFDPDAVVRCGAWLVAAEDAMIEDRVTEATAKQAVAAAQDEWYRRRSSLDIVVGTGRRLTAKIAEAGEDRRAMERLSFASAWRADE